MHPGKLLTRKRRSQDWDYNYSVWICCSWRQCACEVRKKAKTWWTWEFWYKCQIRLSTSALVDLPGSESAGQLVYFGLTQICGNTWIQVLAPTGQVPVKSHVLTDILSTFRSFQYLQVLTNVYIVNMINLCFLLCKLYRTKHTWYHLVQW